MRERELIEFIARSLVESPAAVSIKEIRGSNATILELRVAPGDMGRVIGKDGRVANAMRTLLKVSAGDRRFVLEIV